MTVLLTYIALLAGAFSAVRQSRNHQSKASNSRRLNPILLVMNAPVSPKVSSW